MNTFINDRSNLDEVVALIPDADGKHTIKLTRLQDLQRHNASPRRDIVLINCTRTDNQYCLEVTSTGFSGDTWILDILSDAEYIAVQRIAKHMRNNARNYPEAAKLMADYDAIAHLTRQV